MEETGTENVTNTPEISEFAPDWSPDGAWIAYHDGTSGAISLVSPDGTRRRTLPFVAPNADAPARYPDWAPNGTRIAFALSGDIWVINVNGTGLKNLTADGPRGRDDFGPAWSPDGRKIVFIGDGGETYGLFTMNADGTHIQTLLDLELGSSNITPPSWTER